MSTVAVLLLQSLRYTISYTPDESGWAWHIPLHNGTVSVGVVMEQRALNQRHVDLSQISILKDNLPPNPSSLVMKYLYALEHHAPGILKLILPGKLLQASKSEGRMGVDGVEMIDGPVKTASDFSYSASSYAGPGYRIVGDAGGEPCSTSYRRTDGWTS